MTAPTRDLLAFTPVPVRGRRDGWSPERQRRFIELLVSEGTPARAARALGMSKEGAYALRRRPDAAEFAAAWDAALAARPRRTRPPNLYERAIGGVVVPHFYGGLQRSEERRLCDRSLVKLLRIAGRAAARDERPTARRNFARTSPELSEVPNRAADDSSRTSPIGARSCSGDGRARTISGFLPPDVEGPPSPA